MKRFLAILILISVSSTLRAQESPESELEYVRQLGAKGWNDLAKIKIEDLQKRNDPLLNAALPLELAKINISTARLLGPEQRFALFTAARGQLQEFITKNQGKAEAALASVELARLTSYHAQAILSRAMREDDNRSRHAKARPAEAMFIQAGKDIEVAAKALETALADPNNASKKAVLTDELRRAKLDSASNLFDQAKTYLDTGKDAINVARSDIMDRSRKAFSELRKDESSEIGWLANAWLMKIAMEQTDSDQVQKSYEAVLKRRDDKSAHAAVRLVRFFYMQDVTPFREDVEAIGKNPKYAKFKGRDRLQMVQKEGESWLRSYPGYTNTYEGQGVLYELGLAYYLEAEEVKNDPKAKEVKKDPKKPDPKATPLDVLYDKAIKHFDDLAAMDGDKSEAARLISMGIKIRRLGDKAELSTFEEFLMRGMVERDKFREIGPRFDKAFEALQAKTREVNHFKEKLKDSGGNDKVLTELVKTKEAERNKLETEHKTVADTRAGYLKNAVTALNQAMVLVTPKTPVSKVDEAQYYLTGAYLAKGDNYRGVIVAESLGRTRPPTRHAPEAAAIAIATYSNMLAKQPDSVSIRQRLNDIANYVLSPEIQITWKDDAVTSMAHYHLGLTANRENKAKVAIEHLAKIKPDFTDYTYTQGQIVFIAEGAREKADKADKKEQQFFIKAAKDAIARMPPINVKQESGAVVAMYFFAKMEMAKFLYAEAMEDKTPKGELNAVKKCKEMSTFVKALAVEFQPIAQGGRLTNEHTAQIDFSMQVMLKYADLGVADVKFRSERFDEVIAITKNVVDQTIALAKGKPADQPIEMKDYRVTGDILGLALRSHVQKGNVKDGKAILDVLKRLSPPGAPASSSNVVAVLLSDIAGQIKKMIDTKDKDLQNTKGHYIEFLDEITKEYDARGYDNTTAGMLGQAFNSLELPAKAANVYSKVKPPPDLDKKAEKKVVVKADPKEEQIEQAKKQKWEDDVGRYWNAQVEYIKALRATKDADAQKTAEKTIDALLTHPNARFKIQALMEKGHLLEDQQRYYESYLKWKEIIGYFKDISDKDRQKIYFTAYFYQAKTMFKTAQKGENPKGEKLSPALRAKLKEAATRKIVELEFAQTKEGWQIAGPLFERLLNEEPELKAEYDRQKAIRMKTP